jgi:subtilisin family serine protease
MVTEMPQGRFAAFNLDPALAEMVEAAPQEQLLEGILRLDDPALPPAGFVVVSKFNRICTGRFRAADAWTIRRHPNVISLKAARPLGIHERDGAWPHSPWPIDDSRRGLQSLFTGRGCIVAALDFGLDFAHPNFVNRDGTTRVIAFWDQGADYDPARPNRFGYGREHTSDQINAALRTPDPYRTLGYHPAASDTGLGSHGTHTLDIAAGNGRASGSTPSAAPNAGIIFVHLSTPKLGAAGDLGDSVRLLEALDYVDKTANGRPWVVNLSVGSTAGSHDGTSLVEQGMHELLRLGPSRAIVQSAGNYRAANLAVEGWLRDGEHRDLDWMVDPADTTANELDAWYSGKDRFLVAICAPGERRFSEVKLGEVADVTHRGTTVGRIYHRKNDPNNHDNHVELFLQQGAPSGTWRVRLIGDYVISGRFHAWIERDLARPGAQSRFDAKITSTRFTLGTIATSPLPITVGAYDAGSDDKPPAHFSSLGPTRDGRTDKPELLAPGVKVVAARSIPRNATRQQGLLIARSGTSMAAPHVTGVVAAMLEAAGRPVSIDVIRDCLKRSAAPVAAGKPPNQCAWGLLDAAKAIRSICALKDADRADATISSAAQKDGVLLDEGAAMNSDTRNRVLDEAERALAAVTGDRRQSESTFLQRLLRSIDVSASPAGLSPATLLRGILRDNAGMNLGRGVLDVLGLPAQRPVDELRPGDWMLRFAAGTGDVGHVAVLASERLMTRSLLAAEGVASESMQPGQYGLVIEAGAYPHNRSRRYARRLLDGRGLVPANTVLLRPRFPEPTNEPDQAPDIPELEALIREIDGGGAYAPAELGESGPTFPVGHVIPASGPTRRYVRMPITFEDLVAGATGQVLRRVRCDTLAEVDATGEELPLSQATDPILRFILVGDLIRSFTPANALWRTDSGGNLEASLDLVVYFPASAAGAATLATGGPFPLAIICHGNHNAFDAMSIAAETPLGTLPSGQQLRQVTRLTFGAEVQSHMGYSAISRVRPPGHAGAGTIEYLQEELARHGIISASVSTNGANVLDLLIETRADYVVEALREMGDFAAHSASPFLRKIDFDKVAYIGHSRGGDAVVRAVHKDRSAKVRALVQLAPTDLSWLANGTRPAGTVPAKTSYVTEPMRMGADLSLKYFCIYGSRDGDVSGWTDERMAGTGTGFRHYDRAAVQRAFQFWHGATHNRFNRFWEDADEPFAPPHSTAIIALDFLERIDQERRTNEAVGGWLSYVLRNDVAEANRFNGRTLTAIAPSLAVVRMWKFGRKLKTIDRFDDDRRSDRNTLGGSNIPPISRLVDELRMANDNPTGAGDSNFQFMHIDPVLRASLPQPAGAPSSAISTSGAWRAEIPLGHQDFSGFTLLTLRVTKRFEESAILGATTAAAKATLLPTVTVAIRDRAGGRAAVAAASSAGVPSLPDVRHVARPGGGPDIVLTKYHFETWEVPLSGFTGVDLRRVASVEVEMAGLAGQSVYADTISLVQLH